MQLGKMGKAVQSVGQMSMNNAAFSTLAHMPLPSSNPIHQKGRATKLTMELSWAPFLGRNVSEKARCGSNFSTGNSGPIQDSQKQEHYGPVSQKTKQRLGGYGFAARPEPNKQQAERSLHLHSSEEAVFLQFKS